MPMSVPDPDAQIVPVDRLDLGFAPYRWRFAEERRDDIAAHFAARRKATPALWNGRMLLMRDLMIANGTLRGVFFETGFADFMAWRDWNCPDQSVANAPIDRRLKDLGDGASNNALSLPPRCHAGAPGGSSGTWFSGLAAHQL